jgi:type VI secretion system Hcp family effector
MSFKRVRWILFFMLALALPVGPVEAALSSFMELTEEPGGTPITGGATQSGREGQVEVYEFHHLMEVPGGQTAVDHQTVIVTIPLNDRSIPTLLQKMDSNALLGATIHFWQPTAGGAEQNYLDVTLTGAKVVSFEPLQPNNTMADLAPLPATARIRLSYATINVNNLPAASNHTLTNSGN